MSIMSTYYSISYTIWETNRALSTRQGKGEKPYSYMLLMVLKEITNVMYE